MVGLGVVIGIVVSWLLFMMMACVVVHDGCYLWWFMMMIVCCCMSHHVVAVLSCTVVFCTVELYIEKKNKKEKVGVCL